MKDFILLWLRFFYRNHTTIVYGEKECLLALEQKLVDSISTSQKQTFEETYLIYGFTSQGEQFKQQFQIVALLYPGCVLSQ